MAYFKTEGLWTNEISKIPKFYLVYPPIAELNRPLGRPTCKEQKHLSEVSDN